jgi:SH3-like domain-containing protein
MAKHPFAILVSLVCLAGTSAAVSGFAGLQLGKPLAIEPGEITASTSHPAGNLGTVTKLPLPRFVTLKAEKVNVRRGPSSDHPVAFMFQRKGMPVEITAEFENWRKIRDSDGAEGWILQSMLSGRRNAYVAHWSSGKVLDLHLEPALNSAISARFAPGVLAAIKGCDGQWCEVSAEGHGGFAEQSQLWGVYPDEIVD